MTRALVLVVALALLAHGTGLANGFVYDDHRFVEGNPALVDLSIGRALLDPSTHTADRDRDVYRPLRALGHAFDLSRWGADPFGFHLHSILVHAANAALGLLLLVHLLGRRHLLSACAGATVLAAHPLGVEVAGWISSRGDLYALLFGLPALALGTGLLRARVLAPALAAACAALATLGKESAAVLPLVAWLAVRVLPCDGLRDLDRDGRAARAAPDRFTRWILPGALAAGAAAALVLRQFALSGLTPVQTAPHGGSGGTQVVWALFGLAQTLAHALLPTRLAVEYEQATWATGGLAGALPAACVGLVVALAPLGLRRRAPLAAGLLTWALVAYLPSSSLLVTLRTLVNDRAAYPCLLPLGALLGLALERLPRLRVAGTSPRAGALALALLATALVPLAVARTAVFRDDASLWRDVLRRDPRSVRAWVGLAAEELERDPSAAGEHLRRAVDVASPGGTEQAVALARLGDHVLRREGDPSAALPILAHALEAARRTRERGVPSYDELATAGSLAEALTRLGRYDEAEDVMARALADEPTLTLLWIRLADLRLLRAQQEDDAALLERVGAALAEARRLSPDDPLVRERVAWLARNAPRR